MADETSRSTLPPPYALALVLADFIWQDPSTGKRTILGTFSMIGAREFPATHPILAVHFALTDGRGTVPVAIRVVDSEEEHEPLAWSSDVLFADPRAVVEGNMIAQNVVFPTPGEYRVQLLAAGTLLLERRLIVHQIPEAQP